MDVEKTIKNLRERHFAVSHFAGKEEAAAYLCSDAAEFVSGQVLCVDGGMAV